MKVLAKCLGGQELQGYILNQSGWSPTVSAPVELGQQGKALLSDSPCPGLVRDKWAAGL